MRLADADEAKMDAAVCISDLKTSVWEQQAEKEALQEELDSLKAAGGAVRQEGKCNIRWAQHGHWRTVLS